MLRTTSRRMDGRLKCSQSRSAKNKKAAARASASTLESIYPAMPMRNTARNSTFSATSSTVHTMPLTA